MKGIDEDIEEMMKFKISVRGDSEELHQAAKKLKQQVEECYTE